MRRQLQFILWMIFIWEAFFVLLCPEMMTLKDSMLFAMIALGTDETLEKCFFF